MGVSAVLLEMKIIATLSHRLWVRTYGAGFFPAMLMRFST